MPAVPAPRDGVLALAFHTLLSFQGASKGFSSATRLWFPPGVPAARAAVTVARAFRLVKLRVLPGWYPLRSHRRSVATSHRSAAPRPLWAPRRPPKPLELRSLRPSATSCLPLSTSHGRHGQVLVLKNFPLGAARR